MPCHDVFARRRHRHTRPLRRHCCYALRAAVTLPLRYATARYVATLMPLPPLLMLIVMLPLLSLLPCRFFATHAML